MADETITTTNETTVGTETQPNKSAGTTTEAKLIPQDEVNRLMGETRNKAKQTEREAILKALGIDDLDKAAALLKAQRERDEAEKSESQKAIERAEQAEKALADLNTQLESERQARVIDRRDNAIKAKAQQAHDVEDVLMWAAKPANADLLKATVNDDGSVNAKAVDALIAACRANAKHLWKAGGVGSPSNSGGTTPDLGKSMQERASRINQRTIRG